MQEKVTRFTERANKSIRANNRIAEKIALPFACVSWLIQPRAAPLYEPFGRLAERRDEGRPFRSRFPPSAYRRKTLLAI
jgi:hypothetical protein